MVFPCKDCKDRHLGCHDECEKYQIIKAESDELRRKIKQERDNNATLYRMNKSRIRSMRKINNIKTMRGK